jgi:prolyl-tRNA synthetase
MVMLLVRGDHMLNEIKATKVPGLNPFRFATDAEIRAQLKAPPDRLAPSATPACESSPTARSPP